MMKPGKTQAEIYIGNTTECDTKSSQVRVTIVKRTKIWLKELTVNRSQKKNVGIANEYVTQLKKNICEELSLSSFNLKRQT